MSVYFTPTIIKFVILLSARLTPGSMRFAKKLSSWACRREPECRKHKNLTNYSRNQLNELINFLRGG